MNVDPRARGSRPNLSAGLKRLLLRSGGRCAFPDCGVELVDQHHDSVIAEFAHIRGREHGAARHDSSYPADELDSHENLIVVCANHHKVIDGDKKGDTFSIDALLAMKQQHEKSVRSRLNRTQRDDDVNARLLAEFRDELRDLYLLAQANDSRRPTFERTDGALTALETNFSPSWRIRRVPETDYVRNVQWRFRGPRFAMEWRDAQGASLERTSIARSFDLSKVPGEPDELVGLNEIGLDLRFHWRSHWHRELHRWPIERREINGGQKVLWDVGAEILPTIEWLEEPRPSGEPTDHREHGPQPAHSVRPVQDGRYWLLEVTNLGESNDFLVDVVSIGPPVSWTRRYAVPWRSLDIAENKKRDGWWNIPTRSDGAVNLVSWMTKQENAQIFIGGVDPSRPEVLLVHSVIHPRGFENFKIEEGMEIDFAVEVRSRSSREPMAYSFRLTIQANGIDLVQVAPSPAGD